MRFKKLPPLFWPHKALHLTFSGFYAIEGLLLKATLDTDERLWLWLDASADIPSPRASQRCMQWIVRLLLQVPDTAPEARRSDVRRLSASQIAWLDQQGFSQERQREPLPLPEGYSPLGHSPAVQTKHQQHLSRLHQEAQANRPQNTGTAKGKTKGPRSTPSVLTDDSTGASS